jgi:outer membrane autotransporter protein
LIGVGIGGNFATIESGPVQRGKANTFLLSWYGGYTYNDTTVTANMGYASSEYLLNRNASNARLESKFGGDSFLVGAECSRKIRLPNVDVIPFGSLQMVTLSVGGYDEKLYGIDAVHVSGMDSLSLLQTLGVRFGRMMNGPRGTLWNPSFSAGWVHDHGDGDIRSMTTYGGAVPFALTGAIKQKDRGTIGLNLNVSVRRLSVFAAYDAETASGYYGNTIQSGFTFAF